MKFSDSYQVKLSEIPLINLRRSFDSYYEYVTSDVGKSSLDKSLLHFETDFGFSWTRTANSFISSILLSSIHGLESYLCGAVFNKTLNKDANSPWKLGARTSVDNYFHNLPSLLDKSFSLKVSNNSLWAENKKFYNEIRNPLSHGYEIDDHTESQHIVDLFEHLSELYKWIDSWYDLEMEISKIKGIVGFILRAN